MKELVLLLVWTAGASWDEKNHWTGCSGAGSVIAAVYLNMTLPQDELLYQPVWTGVMEASERVPTACCFNKLSFVN